MVTMFWNGFYIVKHDIILLGVGGGGPRVVVNTAAFIPHPRVKDNIVGSLRDWKVACSASDR